MLNSLFKYPKLIKVPDNLQVDSQQSSGKNSNLGGNPLNPNKSIFDGVFNSAPKKKEAMDPLSGQQMTANKAENINQQRIGQYKEKIKKNNEGVKLHEQAHLGPAATSGINLDTKTDKLGNKIVTSGHVMVRTAKALDEKQPLQRIKKEKMLAQQAAQQAIGPQTKGVPAPHNELSAADKNVYAKNMAAFRQLQQAEQKRENIDAKIAKFEGKKPQGVLKTEKLDKAKKAEGQNNLDNGSPRRNKAQQVINFIG